jgi:hypothetical protein
MIVNAEIMQFTNWIMEVIWKQNRERDAGWDVRDVGVLRRRRNTCLLLLMELDFFQIKLREKEDEQWSRIALTDVHGGVTVLFRR